MRVIIDAREYDALQPDAPPDYGASEPLVMRVAKALSAAGHRVDGVWKGDTELYVDGVIWWPWSKHPSKCDVLISCEWLIHANEFEFKKLYVPLNKINPILDKHEGDVDGFIVFTEEHKRQLLLYNETIKEEQCIILPVGVDVPEDRPKKKNNLIWCHTPERGLVHLARQWPEILRAIPDATLTLTYGVDRSWETNKWLMDALAENLLECIRWKEQYAGSIIDLGRSPVALVQQAQATAEIAPYPCDAPLPGIVTSFAVMECAAAGAALILANLEGLPHVFGEFALMLDIPILEQEWVKATVELLRDDVRKSAMAKAGREWAMERPWSMHAESWCRLVEQGSMVTA